MSYQMALRLERVLNNDPGIGVARHADAGYESAISNAENWGIKIPMKKGASRRGPLTVQSGPAPGAGVL